MKTIDALYEEQPKTSPLKQIGGKFRQRKMIVEHVKKLYDPHKRVEFRDPFVAGAAVTFEMMRSTNIHRYWLNDKDPAIVAFWQTVHKHSELLRAYIAKGAPTQNDFKIFCENLLTLKKVPIVSDLKVAIGYQKMVIQRLSRSGLGTIATSACGDIEERWNPNSLTNELENMSRMMLDNEVKVTNYDFEQLILDESRRAILYVDPPYFIRGKQIYQHNMSIDDHVRLSVLLKESHHRFVLSYDDCDEILDLYSGWTKIKRVPFKYTNSNVAEAKNELLIIR